MNNEIYITHFFSNKIKNNKSSKQQEDYLSS